MMSVARITEISAASPKGFDDAVRQGIDRANKTLRNVRSAWIEDQEVEIDEKGKIAEYRVHMKVTFVLEDAAPSTNGSVRGRAATPTLATRSRAGVKARASRR
jgi:flavin-binding protein dodecin